MTSLDLDCVSKRFGGVDAVIDLSMVVPPGHVTGLIGPNGAGKTTVINMVAGILPQSSGCIRLGQREVSGLKPHDIARCGIARTFQNVRLLREATVLDNIVVGCHRHVKTSMFANSVGLPSVWRERTAFRQRAHQLLVRFGMKEFAETRAGGLSYGHQRRVEIMRALALSPSFLLLDEPVAGMNDVEALAIGTTIRELAKEGIGVLVIEHNMRFVMQTCETIHVLDSGRLIASGSPAAVSRDPGVIQAYLGS